MASNNIGKEKLSDLENTSNINKSKNITTSNVGDVVNTKKAGNINESLPPENKVIDPKLNDLNKVDVSVNEDAFQKQEKITSIKQEPKVTITEGKLKSDDEINQKSNLNNSNTAKDEHAESTLKVDKPVEQNINENIKQNKDNNKSTKVVTSFVLHPNKVNDKKEQINYENVIKNDNNAVNISQVDEKQQENKKTQNNFVNYSVNNETSIKNAKPELTINDVSEKTAKQETFLATNEKTKDNKGSNINDKGFNETNTQNRPEKVQIEKEDKPINLKVKKTVKDVTEQKQEQVKTEVSVDYRDKKTTLNEKDHVESNTEKIVNVSDTGKQNNTNSGFDFKEHKENNTPINTKVGEVDNVKSGKVFEETIVRTNNERNVKLTEVIKEVSRYLEKHDKSSMTLNIEPENMGKVKITVDVSDKVVRANITVETEVVKNMLESKLGDLQSNLNKNNNQQGMVNISLQNEHKGNDRQSGKRKMTGENKQVDKIENETEDIKKSLGYNTMEYLV